MRSLHEPAAQDNLQRSAISILRVMSQGWFGWFEAADADEEVRNQQY